MNPNAKALLFALAGLGAGAGLMWTLRPAAAATAQAPGQPTAPKQMYQCPMHPQIILDHPGDCPICGMALVPMEGHGEAGAVEGHAVVAIDPERQQLIGLRTEKAAEGLVGGELRSVGRVAVDETRVRKVNVKVDGFVERLFVDFVGKPVAKGQPLFTLYSPELLSAQNEFLLALRTRKSLAGSPELKQSGEELVASARRRLALWDIPASVLDTLERTGQPTKTLTIFSPASGVVTAKNLVEGARVTPADIPFEITDLSRVWVLVDIYEAELGRAKVGTPAEFTVQASPGKTFQGRVAFLDPVMDPKTRTAKARVEFANPKGELKPEMFGEVLFRTQGRKGLLVPLDAVLDAGTSKVAFLALGDGRFEPRVVTIGTTVGEQVEITSGLKAGDEVVVRANFLVDSESRLKAALAHLSQKGAAKPDAAPTPAAAPSGHQH
ncbi:MAG: efflux RND transporter periplasmic adaptor subunit [Holophagaceae bacterium]|nr:efflux RND transporter periplasmic adaptor subunit [Holophagaceae bacterium]